MNKNVSLVTILFTLQNFLFFSSYSMHLGFNIHKAFTANTLPTCVRSIAQCSCIKNFKPGADFIYYTDERTILRTDAIHNTIKELIQNKDTLIKLNKWPQHEGKLLQQAIRIHSCPQFYYCNSSFDYKKLTGALAMLTGVSCIIGHPIDHELTWFGITVGLYGMACYIKALEYKRLLATLAYKKLPLLENAYQNFKDAQYRCDNKNSYHFTSNKNLYLASNYFKDEVIKKNKNIKVNYANRLLLR